MNILKLFVYVFFGSIGAVLLALLSAVGGLIGGGTGLVITNLYGNAWAGALAGGVVSALAFHGAIKCIDFFLRRVAEREAQEGGSPMPPPSLARGGRHLWGALSYFVSTTASVYCLHSVFSTTDLNLAATIVGSGFLGLVGLAVTIWLRLWEPSFKSK